MTHDKKTHAMAGFFIAVLFTFLLSPDMGMLAAIVAGMAKVLHDEYIYYDFDHWDMLATWAGGAVGVILTEAIK